MQYLHNQKISKFQMMAPLFQVAVKWIKFQSSTDDAIHGVGSKHGIGIKKV